MSSLIDLASLVLAPTATKEGKVYSAIPDTGEGDMTFTRGSAATRVNSAGLIEKERGNLLLQSNTFDTTWTTSNASVTGGQSGYDGSSDAWLLSISGGTSAQRVQQNVSQSGVQTFSVYAKKGSLNWVRIRVNATTTAQTYFDLENGVVGSVQSGLISRSIEDIGFGWYRCSITFNSTSSVARIYPATGDGNTTQSSGNIYIQDAQLDQGLVAQPYIETTTTAVYEGITDDVPRVDYSGGGCPSLLLEPQRTNVITQSEYFNDSSAWFKYNLGSGSIPVVTDNYAVSPEGVQNATRLQLDAGGVTTGDRSRLYTNQNTTSGTDYTFSFYAKSNTGNNEYIKPRAESVNYSEITITTEWQRFDVSFTAGATGSVQFGFECRGNHTENSADILIYGAMLEVGSYSTSLIPTYGTSTTRVADSCSKTGISELIGQSEGTIYWEGVINGLDNSFGNIITSERNVTTSFSVLARKSDMQFQCAVFDGSTKGQCTGGSLVFGTKHKLAYAYKSEDFALYVDGVQAATSTQTWSPSGTIDDIYIADLITFFGYKEGNEHTQAMLFPTRLTNEELEEITK